ncbi:MAG TPA: MFS transporter [Dehalococcoidia bacterium]|nr:MFS transporter [Dehalococcoidia bacterium]
MSSPISRFRTPLAVFAVAAGLFMGLLDLSIVTIVIPEVGRDLDASFTQMSWVVNAYVLVTAAAIIPAGKLGDAVGRKRVFAAGMALFATASLLCGLAPGAGWLIAFRALQGLGGAAMVTLSLALLSQILPEEKRQLGYMLWSATGGLALAAGPSLGGVLTEFSTWRWVFIVNVPIAAVAFPLVLISAAEQRSQRLERVGLDWAGLVTVVGGLTALSLGLLQGQDWGWTSTRIVTLLSAAAVLLAAFLAIETAVRAPMVPLRYFRNPRFAAACAGWFGAMFAFISVFFFLPVYLEVVREYSVLKASLALSPGPFMAFLLAPVAMVAARRLGPAIVCCAGIALVGTSVLVTSRIGADWSYTQIILLALFTGTGFGLAVPTLTQLAMDALDDEEVGIGAGIFNTVRQVAGVVALSTLGAALQERMISSFSGALGASAVPEGIRPAVQSEFERRATQRTGLSAGELPAELAAEIHRLASTALVDGLELVYVIAGVVCLATLAVAGALLVRAPAPRTKTASVTAGLPDATS